MRLATQHIAIIKQVTQDILGPQAQVTLFGSRVNDHLKGGDIDLLIETPTVVPNRAVAAARVAAGIERQIGERQIDVVLVDPLTAEQAVHLQARAHGVRL
jgi:predicted nucleotidyltransferase